MREDSSYDNFIVKSDVYNSTGHLIDHFKTNLHQNTNCISGSTTKEYTYLVPIYYAVRIYGPLLAEVKCMDHLIDTIAFDNDVCSSVNAVKSKGICYFPDMEIITTGMIAGGYPWTSWSALMMSEWIVVPSFSINHPKIGSGQYMAQVCDLANIGYFSHKGKCEDTYYHNGILHCDSLPSVNIRMVEYTSFHRSPVCNVHDNNSMVCSFSDPPDLTVCNHNIHNLVEFDKKCQILQSN